MTYAAYETSTFLGKPIYFYRFAPPFGDYNYTNAPLTLTPTINSVAADFTPVTISHTEPELTSETFRTDLEITLPRSNPFALANRSYPVPGETWLTIYRKHKDDTEVRQWWSGRVTRVSFDEGEATIACESLMSVLQIEGLSETFQNLCNFFLYDGRCPVNAVNWRTLITIVSIADNVYTVSGSAAIDDWFTAGFLEADNGDKRFILDHGTSGANKVLTLNQAFPSTTLAAGDTAYVYAGCDRLYTTCVNKFGAETGSGAAYGGNPIQTTVNPHMTGRMN